MSLIHTITSVFFKILTTAVLIVLAPHEPVVVPSKAALAPWQLPNTTKVATTTLSQPAPLITASTATTTKLGSKNVSTVSSTTPVKPKPAPAVTAITIPPITTNQPPITQTPLTVSGDLNAKTREALVNVLCVTSTGGYLRPISGSGIIIDPRGVVLTNAHIGQFFLLRDYPFKDNIQCVLRAGSPASPLYTAQLLYFPKSWLDVNAEKIVQETPTGTGEHDFSLLLITGRTNPLASLPSTFPHLEPYISSGTRTGDSVLLAGYPAGFLEGATIETSLYISSAIGTVQEIFTFKEGGGIDLISIPGTILSQKGSSGGAVVRSDTGELTGLIVTATLASTTAQRDLRAITLRHINLSIIADTGQSLSSYLSGDLQAKAQAFTLNVVPKLSKMLTDVLNK
jgi:hypothetical protein